MSGNSREETRKKRVAKRDSGDAEYFGPGIKFQSPSQKRAFSTDSEVFLLSWFLLFQADQLTEENEALKQELQSLKQMYQVELLVVLTWQQLLAEKKDESVEERRLMLLKVQNMQLERQVVLLSSNLQARQDLLTEMEGQVAHLLELMGVRLRLATDVQEGKKIDKAATQKWSEGMKYRIKQIRRSSTGLSTNLPAEPVLRQPPKAFLLHGSVREGHS